MDRTIPAARRTMGRWMVAALAGVAAAGCAEVDAPTAAEARGTGPSLAVQTGWISGTYSNAYGARFYRLYVPTTYTGATARPLMVMLHGCLQDGYDFAAGTRMNSFAESRNFLVLYPEQGTAYNGADCWNWFSTVNQARGSGEPSLINGMIAWVKANYAVDAARVGVAGFSAGAAMANTMGCTYPDQVRRVAAFAGVMYKGATTSIGGTNAMAYGSSYDPWARGNDCYGAMGSYRRQVPTLVFQGTSDGTVNAVNAHQTLSQWAQANDRGYDALDDGDVDDVADATSTATVCRSYTRYDYRNSATATVVMRKYVISGLGHAWSGGSSAGSYTDSCGPDASAMILDFFGF
jgi:poly(hydroxyalkanoate) depolymerase family esterase